MPERPEERKILVFELKDSNTESPEIYTQVLCSCKKWTFKYGLYCAWCGKELKD